MCPFRGERVLSAAGELTVTLVRIAARSMGGILRPRRLSGTFNSRFGWMPAILRHLMEYCS